MRGYEKKLGAEYTRERIVERIEENVRHRHEMAQKMYGNQPKMIDTSQQRFQESPALKHWANKQNLQAAAKIVSDSGNRAQMANKIDELEQTIKTNYKAQVKAERRRKDRKDVIYYGDQYLKYKQTYDYYMSCPAKDKERIFKINESKIIAFQGAADRLKAAGIDLKRFDEKVYKSYVEQDKADQHEISQYEKARKQAEREKTELEIKMKELDMFMGGSFQREAQRDQEQDQPSKPKKGGDAR